MNVLLWILKGIAFVALVALIFVVAYRHRYAKPATFARCSQCGMPEWAWEERCFYSDCPRTDEQRTQ